MRKKFSKVDQVKTFLEKFLSSKQSEFHFRGNKKLPNKWLVSSFILFYGISKYIDCVVHSISFQTFFVQAFKIVVDSWKFTMLSLYILWDDWPISMISHSKEQIQQQLEYTQLIYIRGAFNKFPNFFVQAFKIVVDSWKFTMLLLYILWDDWPIFMISHSKEQIQQQLEYTQLIYIRGAFNRFPDFFVQAFKIVVDSWKFSILLLYILWDDWQIFMISDLYEQLQQQLEYTLLKPDCHSWWISKMQSGRDDTLEERYAIGFCFKLGKNATKTTYGMLQTAFGASCMNRASVFEWHKRFKEARESVRDREKCGRSKEVNTPQLISQRVRVRVTMLRF